MILSLPTPQAINSHFSWPGPSVSASPLFNPLRQPRPHEIDAVTSITKNRNIHQLLVGRKAWRRPWRNEGGRCGEESREHCHHLRCSRALPLALPCCCPMEHARTSSNQDPRGLGYVARPSRRAPLNGRLSGGLRRPYPSKDESRDPSSIGV